MPEKQRVAGLSRCNNYLKTTLVEAAWVASRTKDTFLSARYYNIARRRGSKRAAVAIGHQILKDIYYILSTSEPYKELGAEAAQNRKSEVRERSIIRELESQGYSVQKIEKSAR